jgi:methionine-rich copper-binding protein CopC
VSRSHAARHQGWGATDPSCGETTWVTRPDYEPNRPGHHVCARDALLHHGNVTRGVRRAAALLIGVLAALVIPIAASAHAELGSSSPQAGAHLGTTPGVVVLEFTQSLNAQLSSAAVVDPSGHTWKGEADSGEEIRVPVATNIPGVYTVNWVSVSEVDGHRITGTFTFDVGVVGVSPTDVANQVPGPQASDVAIGIVKWVEGLALLFLAGQVLMRRLAGRAPPLMWVKPGFRASSVALSAGLVVVWAGATVASGGHSLSNYVSYFEAGWSGAVLIARLVLEALTLIAVVRGWRLLPVLVAGTLVLLAAAGHAAASTQSISWLRACGRVGSARSQCCAHPMAGDPRTREASSRDSPRLRSWLSGSRWSLVVSRRSSNSGPSSRCSAPTTAVCSWQRWRWLHACSRSR